MTKIKLGLIKLILTVFIGFTLPIVVLELTAEPYISTRSYLLDSLHLQELRLKRAYKAFLGANLMDIYSKRDLEFLASYKARKHGFNPSLVKALISKESSWNSQAVSRVGALGLAQVMPEWTNHKLCPSLTQNSDLFDPAKNLDCGLSVLRQNVHDYGDLFTALQIYNGGPRCLNKKDCFEKTSIYANDIILRSKTLG